MRTTEILCPEMSKTYLQEHFVHDLKNPLNQKLDAIEDFKGLTILREKTDSRMLLLILVILAALAITFPMSFRRFNASAFMRPQDFRADYCGENYLATRPCLYWPDPLNWGTAVKLCVTDCPTEDNTEMCLYDEYNASDYDDYCFLTKASFVFL